MKIKFIIIPFLILMHWGAIYPAMAVESSQVNIKARIVATPCEIDTTNVNVDLGDIHAGDLETSGSASAWKPFILKLTNCTDAHSVVMTFTGKAAADGVHFANEGTAQHLYIGLASSLNYDIPLYPGATMTAGLQGATTDISILEVRVANDGTGAATQGTVVSTITVGYEFK